MMDLCYKVGLPITLKEVGIHRDDEKAIREIAERALAPGESSHNEPFEVTTDMLMDAIRAADRMGSLFHVEEHRKGHHNHVVKVPTPGSPRVSHRHSIGTPGSGSPRRSQEYESPRKDHHSHVAKVPTHGSPRVSQEYGHLPKLPTPKSPSGSQEHAARASRKSHTQNSA